MATSGRCLEDGPDFDAVLNIIQEVRALGLEACVSLGLINAPQAKRLKEAGCTVYNHNLDTSRLMYGRIVSTHTFDERLGTIRAVREAGLQVCCGGILGLGETVDDRIHFLDELNHLDPPPEAIPLNILVPIPGTPLEDMPPVPAIEVIRVIATARILFPNSRIRLAAGRSSLSPEAQALAFLCGANSIFTGEKLLTTPGTRSGTDQELVRLLGMAVEGPQVEIPVH
jgi:biotin synthase